MDASFIHHRLDLVLQLVDTTTGAAVGERNVQIFIDGRQCFPIARGIGNFVFINTGRVDNTMTLKVFGYEEAVVSVQYEKLDEAMPIQQVFLIPSEKLAGGEKLCSLTGRIHGLESIEAVSLTQSNLFFSEFNEKKGLMKLFIMKGRLSMENVHYGLISMDGQYFEHIEVAEELPPNSVRLKTPLKETFAVNSPISRVIFGKALPDGKYLLRVRDDAKTLKYLVRYSVNGEIRFQVVDFHHCMENELQ